MRNFMLTLSMALAVCWFPLAAPAAAPATLPESDAVPPPAMQTPPRDPTQPSPQLRDLLSPRPKNESLPPLELKGRILATGQTPLVLLAMDKQLLIARQGAEISLDGEHGGMSIRVTQVTSGEVRLEIVPLGRVVSLF